MPTIFSRQDLPIRVLASGGRQSIPVFRFEGDTGGAKVYIQANIHGPEIAGIGAIHVLIDCLHAEPVINGSITLIPSVNPVGLDTKFGGMQVGYVDPNESAVANFNRIYQMLVRDTAPENANHPRKLVLSEFVEQHKEDDLPSLISAFKAGLGAAIEDIAASKGNRGMQHGLKLALTIQRLSHDADYLLDLHTGGYSARHNFVLEECLPSAPLFGIPHLIILDGSFNGVLDEAFLLPWVRLQKALAEAGRNIPFADFQKETFTLELGSADTLSREAMDNDAESILNYLRAKGVLEGEVIQHNMPFYTCHEDDYQRYNAPTGGLILWDKHPGDSVRAGERIVAILQTYQRGQGDTETPIYAERDGVVINSVESQVVHEGQALCSIMTKLAELRR